ncbi:hypothetical protein RRG08_001764 [Elysia crispata]|uniref:Uncharacterized protein n=1 Tax=Elysia crispata TaxID=231223 RepID=A0AAE1E0C7_9GAST|nr:hypothetical protein RRG08_001764 [Elysia crispata]
MPKRLPRTGVWVVKQNGPQPAGRNHGIDSQPSVASGNNLSAVTGFDETGTFHWEIVSTIFSDFSMVTSPIQRPLSHKDLHQHYPPSSFQVDPPPQQHLNDTVCQEND